jgi:hypothetical protein
MGIMEGKSSDQISEKFSSMFWREYPNLYRHEAVFPSPNLWRAVVPYQAGGNDLDVHRNN